MPWRFQDKWDLPLVCQQRRCKNRKKNWHLYHLKVCNKLQQQIKVVAGCSCCTPCICICMCVRIRVYSKINNFCLQSSKLNNKCETTWVRGIIRSHEPHQWQQQPHHLLQYQLQHTHTHTHTFSLRRTWFRPME